MGYSKHETRTKLYGHEYSNLTAIIKKKIRPEYFEAVISRKKI